MANRWSDEAGWLMLAVMIAAATALVMSVRRWSSPTIPRLTTVGGT
jgi:hypothetical protein